LAYQHDDGLVDHDGDDIDWYDNPGAMWAYLPHGFDMWCENRAEDPVTFPASGMQLREDAPAAEAEGLQPVPEATPKAHDQSHRITELEDALRYFAKQHTIAEIMSGQAPKDWVKASAERRIEMIGERKEANDAAILHARSVLSKGED